MAVKFSPPLWRKISAFSTPISSIVSRQSAVKPGVTTARFLTPLRPGPRPSCRYRAGAIPPARTATGRSFSARSRPCRVHRGAAVPSSSNGRNRDRPSRNSFSECRETRQGSHPASISASSDAPSCAPQAPRYRRDRHARAARCAKPAASASSSVCRTPCRRRSRSSPPHIADTSARRRDARSPHRAARRSATRSRDGRSASPSRRRRRPRSPSRADSLLGLRARDGLERPLVAFLVPDRLVIAALRTGPFGENDQIEDRPPQPARRFDHAPVRQELLQIGPHRPIGGAFGCPEIDQQDAGLARFYRRMLAGRADVAGRFRCARGFGHGGSFRALPIPRHVRAAAPRSNLSVRVDLLGEGNNPFTA